MIDFPEQYDTFISKGFNTFRLNIQMERLSPNTIDGNLDATYLDMIKEQVDYVTGKGAYIMINPHNYGRYYGQIYRDTQAFGKSLSSPDFALKRRQQGS